MEKLKINYIQYFKKRIKIIAGIVIIGIPLMVLIMFTYNTYHTYRDTLVEQQQDHLLTISKVLSKGIEIYFEEQYINLKFVEKNIHLATKHLLGEQHINDEMFEEIVSIYTDEWDFSEVYILNKDAEICCQYNHGDEKGLIPDYDFSQVIKDEITSVGEVYTMANGNLAASIVVPIKENDKTVGALVGLIDMNHVFKKLIEGTKVGEKGYVMVKDEKGMILMHPVQEQIGTNVIEGRKDKFPDLDYSDLEELINLQYKQSEGVAEYYSYWWDETKMKRVKKISSFSHVKVGKAFWVLAAVMDYSEMAEPIHESLAKLLELTGVTILIITITGFIIFLVEKKHQYLIKESRYLKNINYTLSELQQSQRKIRHYEKLKSIETLTGGIAHEFNNLMTPILGYSQLALATMDKEHEYYEDMEEIYNASYKAKELLKQIMLFSRRGKTVINYKIIDLGKEILAGLKMVSIGLGSNIKLVTHIDLDTGNIYASPTQIQQVLINICNNAVQAMQEEGGILTVSLYRATKEEVERVREGKSTDKDYLCLKVSDTGVGMPQEVLERIFEPFFTTKNVGEGTGVGLSVLKGIVRNHNGKILVESKVEEGSTFRVYFPECKEAIVCSETIKKSDTVVRKQASILLVEDEVRVVKMIKKSLGSLGYSIKAYTDSEKALEYYKQHPEMFDLIVTDYAMPKLNGSQLSDAVKEIRGDIKIVMITGLITPEIVNHIKRQVINTFVMKPIDYEELDEKIRQVLDE